MSTSELGCEVGVQQKTARLFKPRIQIAMKQDNKYKLKGNVDTDKTLVGRYRTSHRGRSLQSKKALLLTVEKLPDGRYGNLRIRSIKNFEACTLKFTLKHHDT